MKFNYQNPDGTVSVIDLDDHYIPLDTPIYIGDGTTQPRFSIDSNGYTGNLEIHGIDSPGTLLIPYGKDGTVATTSELPTNFTRTNSGLVPNPGGSGTTRYLREDGSWSTVPTTTHTHVSLKANTDNRNINTIPNDYNSKFEIKGLKSNSVLGISSAGEFSYVFGIRSWVDSSGGVAHEFALTGNGKLYHRTGLTTSWGSWNKMLTEEDFVLSGTTLTINIS